MANGAGVELRSGTGAAGVTTVTDTEDDGSGEVAGVWAFLPGASLELDEHPARAVATQAMTRTRRLVDVNDSIHSATAGHPVGDTERATFQNK